MTDTNRSLYEIEIALSKYNKFNYIKNIVAFNVLGESDILPLWHECDMLVLTKSGYLTEIEIKRSYSDFVADFKKKHHHESELIKYFYYCVPISIFDKVREYICENEINCSGIITYDEDLNIVINSCKRKYKDKNGNDVYYEVIDRNMGGKKLFIEQMLEVARFGAMRSIMLKEKLLKAESENELLIENKSKSDYKDGEK